MTVLHYPVKRLALAKVLRISPPTLTDRLREIGINHRRTLSVADLKKVLENFDLPSDVEIKM